MSTDGHCLSGRGYKFDSGALRIRATNEALETPSELDIFRILNIPWVGEQIFHHFELDVGEAYDLITMFRLSRTHATQFRSMTSVPTACILAPPVFVSLKLVCKDPI